MLAYVSAFYVVSNFILKSFDGNARTGYQEKIQGIEKNKCWEYEVAALEG